jgi:hypothetical protein
MYLKNFIEQYQNSNDLLRFRNESQFGTGGESIENFKLSWNIIEKIINLNDYKLDKLLYNLLSIRQIYLPDVIEPKNLELIFSSYKSLSFIIKSNLLILNNYEQCSLFNFLIKKYMDEPEFKTAFLLLHISKLKNELAIININKSNNCIFKITKQLGSGGIAYLDADDESEIRKSIHNKLSKIFNDNLYL